MERRGSSDGVDSTGRELDTSQVQSEEHTNPENTLKDECTQTWRDVKKMQVDLNALRPPSLAASDDLPAHILLAEEKLLLSQIELYQTKIPSVAGVKGHVAESVLLEDLSETNRQLKETQYVMQNQLKELKSDLARQEEVKTKLASIAAAMATMKEQKAANRGDDKGKNDKELEEIKTKQKNLNKRCKQFRRQLNEFVDSTFPLPTTDEIERVTKKHPGAAVSPDTICSLKTITEELMTKCLSSPQDPYMTLTPEHWPPYVELLLRCGIAITHPEDSSKVKLTPFHL